MEQCGRVTLPVVHPAISWHLPGLLPANGRRILFWEEQRQHAPGLGEALMTDSAPAEETPDGNSQPEPVVVLIGPEGGLTPEEAAMARDELGFRWASLGPRILRAETAALAAITGVQLLAGDLSETTAPPASPSG